MGKRKGRKKKNRRYNYNEHEFVDKVCRKQCAICNFGNPVVCYNELYKFNPQKFITSTLYKLQDTKSALEQMGCLKFNEYSDEDIEFILDTVICGATTCGVKFKHQCEKKAGCLAALRKQVWAEEIDDPIAALQNHFKGGGKKQTKRQIKAERKRLRNEAKRKRKAEREKPASPSFFCNEGLIPEIEGLLNGNNTGKQDKVEKYS